LWSTGAIEHCNVIERLTNITYWTKLLLVKVGWFLFPHPKFLPRPPNFPLFSAGGELFFCFKKNFRKHFPKFSEWEKKFAGWDEKFSKWICSKRNVDEPEFTKLDYPNVLTSLIIPIMKYRIDISDIFENVNYYMHLDAKHIQRDKKDVTVIWFMVYILCWKVQRVLVAQ
jgi:hypothetical protein